MTREALVRTAWKRDLFLSLFREVLRFIVLTGGRSSGKSWTAAQIILLRGLLAPTRILCAREFQSSMRQSVLPLLADLNRSMNLGYRTARNFMVHANGTRIDFHGLSDSTGTARSIRSAHEYQLVHVEEAQFLSEGSWKTLEPTIRAEGSQILATMNPRFRTDPLYALAHSGLESVRHVHTTFEDNSLLSETALASIKDFKRLWPSAFAHEYLGELADDDGTARVLTVGAIDAAFAQYDDVAAPAETHAGWDVADTGADLNALVVRCGPRVVHAERWSGKGKTLAASTARVIASCREHGVDALFVDAGGPGAGAKSDLDRMDPPFRWTMVHAGGRVGGPKMHYQGRDTNAMRFMNRYAQLAWTLRLRTDNTRRRAAGEDVDARECLAFAPGLRHAHGVDWERQLLQPLWEDSASGKIRVRKQPTKTDASPDLFDALALAFTADTDHGLHVGKRPDAFAQWEQVVG